MKFRRVILLGIAATLSACASVPRDAGFDEVQQRFAQAGGSTLEVQTTPSSADDSRLAAMLADELTADEAVQIAVINSPRLQVTLAELGIARADLIEASTISNPLFEFEIRFPGEPYRPYELRLAQSLVELIQLPRRRAAGRAAFDAARMRVTSDVLRFSADVRSAYYDALAAELDARLIRTTWEAARTAADVAVRQHAAENITDLDLENEQAAYEQAKLDLARAEQSLTLRREALARALGLRAGAASIVLPSSFPDLPASESTPEQLEALAAQRLDLAIARSEVELARRQVPLARLSVLDEFVVDFHYEREPGGERTKGPGIEFPIPIFNTGRAARTRAEAQYLMARHTVAALEAESASLLRSATSSLADARARVEYYRDVVVPRRERIVQLTKLQHNAMLVGIYQLLQSKQNEMQARRDYIEAQREYWSARTDLDRAVQGIADDTSFNPATGQGQGKSANVSRGDH